MPLVVAQSVAGVVAPVAPPGVEVGARVEVGAAAGAAKAKGAGLAWKVLAYLLVAIGAVVGWYLFDVRDPAPFKPGAEISLFAPMYILAQAIERFLEPLTPLVGKVDGKDKKTAKEERDGALAAALKATDPGTAAAKAGEAAESQATVDEIRSNRSFVIWGLASAIAMVVCGAFGVRLLSAAGFDVPAFWDIAITGLAVGSGTKPLHDLISNIQKSKNSKEDPNHVVTTD